MTQHHVVPLQFVPTNGSVLLLPVKKAIELKSRGVKVLPNKDGSHKISVCKSSAFYTGIAYRVQCSTGDTSLCVSAGESHCSLLSLLRLLLLVHLQQYFLGNRIVGEEGHVDFVA